MVKSYLFVPANKMKHIEKSMCINTYNYRIFDLEYFLSEEDLETSINNIKKTNLTSNDWIRLPSSKHLQSKVLDKLSGKECNNFVIPKFEGYDDFCIIIENIKKKVNKFKLILLVENHRSYLELEKVLKTFSQCLYGVSLGIHDFTYNLNMKNDYKLLTGIRTNIMIMAKAYGVVPIDVVPANVKDKEKLIKEIVNGFELGYSEKMFIHPEQLDVLEDIEYYSIDIVDECRKVMLYFEENNKMENEILLLNGRIYEEMHIKKMRKILSWGEMYYGTNR